MVEFTPMVSYTFYPTLPICLPVNFATLNPHLLLGWPQCWFYIIINTNPKILDFCCTKSWQFWQLDCKLKYSILSQKNLRSGISVAKIYKYTLRGQNNRLLGWQPFDKYIDFNIVVVKVAFYIQRYWIEIPKSPFFVPLTSKSERFSMRP